MSANDELIKALQELADAIEANPPPIVASDIRIHASSGSVVGQSINMKVGPNGGGSAVGQRIFIVADRPGQTVIGQRINLTLGGEFSPEKEPQLPSSANEIDALVNQLRSASDTLKATTSSRTWISGLVDQASKWGHSAISGAVSGAANALVRAHLGA